MEHEVYKLLDNLGIKYTKINHPPLFTYEDSKKYNINIDAIVCKSLFIKNKNKSQYYIVLLPLDKKADLKQIQMELEETRLSFGDETTLQQKTGIKSGAVSIFNCINMKDKDIIYIIDETLLQYEKVAFHPNVNTETIIFSSKEMYKILEYYDIRYRFIKMEKNDEHICRIK